MCVVGLSHMGQPSATSPAPGHCPSPPRPPGPQETIPGSQLGPCTQRCDHEDSGLHSAEERTGRPQRDGATLGGDTLGPQLLALALRTLPCRKLLSDLLIPGRKPGTVWEARQVPYPTCRPALTLTLP